ncbi:hypothetical protein SAMN04487905_102158 [Actinopolyspora xinjiangensis]|uniref:Uncharacterized protein n=1 Tax=Actinopolyspora xinjiangensis TaxID=405564 RepID=A0A1H0QAY5_9ACTN|nr:DUF5336 domain-containing protein [Actinopolyspora xinjiangensis]SDP14541.1 hypothetical protein SAMN04487905_102158 [Actinopolyspora xinjiangensis]
MSAPYPPPQQPAPPGTAKSQLDTKSILALVAAGIGALGWLFGFFAPAINSILGGLPGLGFMLVALLAAMRFLPKGPDTLFVAAPLAVYTALSMLQNVIVAGLSGSGGSIAGWAIVLMLLALLQAAAVIALLLLEQEIVTAPALGDGAARAVTQQVRPQPGQQTGPYAQPYPGQPQPGGWNPQSGPQQGYPPQQPGQPQQGQPQPGQPQPGWTQQSGGFAPGQPQPPHQAGHPQPQPGQAPGNPYEQPPAQPGQGAAGQPQQEQRADPSGGPQGTQQMPSPNQNPPS